MRQQTTGDQSTSNVLSAVRWKRAVDIERTFNGNELYHMGPRYKYLFLPASVLMKAAANHHIVGCFGLAPQQFAWMEIEMIT